MFKTVIRISVVEIGRSQGICFVNAFQSVLQSKCVQNCIQTVQNRFCEYSGVNIRIFVGNTKSLTLYIVAVVHYRV
jgi:hypothetical protein